MAGLLSTLRQEQGLGRLGHAALSLPTSPRHRFRKVNLRSRLRGKSTGGETVSIHFLQDVSSRPIFGAAPRGFWSCQWNNNVLVIDSFLAFRFTLACCNGALSFFFGGWRA